MTRRVAGPASAVKAALAADALDAFLRSRPPRPDPRPAMAALPDSPGKPLRPQHTDWLRHRVAVQGPPDALASFRTAAAGAGVIPWRLDPEALEEDWFLLLAHPARRSLSLPGARMLAGQLRAAVEQRHALAAALVGRSWACPLDLHALVPVPAPVLHLGPDHPDSLAWLWEHWGTTAPLRHVTCHPAKGALVLGFWSADWTPWRALQQVRDRWPALRLDVRPDYAPGA